jgi:hypothetical protein
MARGKLVNPGGSIDMVSAVREHYSENHLQIPKAARW